MENAGIEKEQTIKLIKDFQEVLVPLMKIFGVSTNNRDLKQFVWEFFNRFYSNLVSLENCLILKDSLSTTLIQRYNHEMLLSFFFVVASPEAEKRVLDYFSYEEDLKNNPGKRTWSTEDKKELRNHVPPWNAREPALSLFYKQLSDLAHPNCISMRLNRRGVKYEYIIMQSAVAMSIFEICNCILYKPFRDIFEKENFDFTKCCLTIRNFQSRCYSLLK